MTDVESDTFLIDAEPLGRRVPISGDSTIFEALREAGISLVSLCGGVGSCDSCRIKLISGRLSAPTADEEALFSKEELEDGWRLACQSKAQSNAKVDIPSESLTTPQRLLLEGERYDVSFDPAVQPLDVTLPPAAIDDLRSDSSRVFDAIAHIDREPLEISYPVLAELPLVLRHNSWSARLVAGSEGRLLAILPPESPVLGLAADIGTTSIAVYLVDLLSGEILGKRGEMNPQIAYGEDVVSRIHYCNQSTEGSALLQKRVVNTVMELAEGLCLQANRELSQIVEIVAVGNTAMHHIWSGLPVRQLGEAPYVPVTSDALLMRAMDIGLKLAPGASMYLPAIIAGYVGADHTSMLLATQVGQDNKTTMAIDIGTNTEVCLSSQGRLFCCSCASGPAFEGAHIRDGMRAAPGAIERMQMREGQLQLQTVGDAPAVGLCGSGIVDAIALMLDEGIINRRGSLDRSHSLVSLSDDGRPQFVIVPAGQSGGGRDVVLTRKDVAEVQLAKSAIRSGIEILFSEAGIVPDEVEEFIIAGAFGSYISVSSAIRMGMFPTLPRDRFRQVGNAAGMGAVQLLLSKGSRHQAAALARQIEYVELTTHPGFSDEFMGQMSF